MRETMYIVQVIPSAFPFRESEMGEVAVLCLWVAHMSLILEESHH